MELALGIALKFYANVEKGLKLKVRKFLGLIRMFVEVTGEKLVDGGLFYLPILNSVKEEIFASLNFTELITAGIFSMVKFL